MAAQDITSGVMGNPQSKIDGMRTLSAIFYIAYLVASGALTVIIQWVRRQATGVLALVTCVVSILGFTGLFAWRFAFVSAMKRAGNQAAADMVSDAIHFGLGAWIILLCGLALTGAPLGIIKLPEKE